MQPEREAATELDEAASVDSSELGDDLLDNVTGGVNNSGGMVGILL